MIELNIKISDLDYDSLADLLMPMLSEHMEKSGLSFLGGMFSPNGAGQSMAKAFFNRLSPDKKEEMIVNCLNGNKAKIISMLQNAARQQNIGVTLCDASAKKV